MSPILKFYSGLGDRFIHPNLEWLKGSHEGELVDIDASSPEKFEKFFPP